MYLVLNCGSQSVKYKLFKSNLDLFKKGEISIKDKKEYIKVLERELRNIKKEVADITVVGHRIVHGGNSLNKPTLVNPRVLEKLKENCGLAPLHNPYGILGIEVSLRVFLKKAKNYVVFDNSFFSDIPEKAYLYALPESLVKKYKFKRFGFHGFSHEYVAEQGAKMIKRPLKSLKIITCHLGGGSSIAAIKAGKAVDTSMGFTPLEGLVMMTRSGSIDPGIILRLNKTMSPAKLDNLLNKESGVKGICGIAEMLGVLAAIKKGNKKAELALDVFVYHIQKYIGAYVAILGGCDLLVFTGTIGFGSAKIRRMITKGLNILKDTKVLAIETNEELQIIKKIKSYEKK